MDKTKEVIIEANKFFETLRENVSSKKEKLEWFNDLMSHLGAIFKNLRDLQKDGTIKDHECALIYLRQLIGILTLLVKVFVKEIEAENVFLEARFYVVNQIQFCMKGFQEDLLEVKDNREDNLLGCFIKLIDYALDKISEVHDSVSTQNELLESCSEARIIFSEVLTHAMVISQISLEEDSKMIEGSCQSVIESLEWIVGETNKKNRGMMNLSVQTCSNKICVLERRVNTAVLKLTLKIFSEYTGLLDKIHTFCFNFSNADKPIIEFASLIEEHDFQVDRIIQIGLFAVSCSSDKMNAVKIRSCLSTLESLETELIPSFAAVLRKQTKHSMDLAMLFKKFWIRQVGLLEGFIFRIIDPFAFCQLVYDENKEILDESFRGSFISMPLTEVRLDNTHPIKKIIAHTRLLMVVLETVKETPKGNNFNKIYTDLKNVFNEVKCVYFWLKKKKDYETYRKTGKRLKILQNTIKAMKVYLLNKDSQEKEGSDLVQVSEILFQKEINRKDPVSENQFLCHIMNRGREILKDRSNIHSNAEMNASLRIIQRITDKKLREMKNDKRRRKEMPLSKYVHLRKCFLNSTAASNFSGVNPSKTINTSITHGELEFSDIIMELNNLTDTFFNLTGCKES